MNVNWNAEDLCLDKRVEDKDTFILVNNCIQVGSKDEILGVFFSPNNWISYVLFVDI